MAETATVDVLARIKADTSNFSKGIKDAERSLSNFSTASVAKGTIIGNVLFQAASKAARGFSTVLVSAFRDSIAGAKQTQAAQDRLRRLLLNTNGATEEQIKILNAHAKALEASTVVSQGNIAAVQSQLATFDLHGSTIATLTPAILDYVVAEKGAAASADQFRSMTNGLASALNGQFGALSRTGFILSDFDKQQIKTGTEAERSAAIVRILNTTYKDFASINGSAASTSVALGKAINKLKSDFGEALLPAVNNVQAGIMAGLIPTLQDLQARFANKEAIERFIKALGRLLTNVKTFATAVKDVLEPIFVNIVVPAFLLAVAAVQEFIKFLGKAGRFITKHKTLLTSLTVALGTYIVVTKLARLATLALGKMMFKVAAIKQAYAFFTYTATGATTKLAFAQHLLNTAMKANPIGLIISVLAGLAIAFKVAFDKSETFRKIVVGAIQFVVRTVAKGLRILGNLPGAVGDFFDKAAVSADKFANSLEKYKTITKKVVDDVNTKTAEVDLSGLGTAGGGKRRDEKEEAKAAKAAASLAKAKNTLKKAVQDYNDFIKKDFAVSFMNGSKAASDAVFKALDKLRKVFDSQAKMLSGGALKKLEAAFDAVNKKVRGMVERYALVAQQIQDVQKQIDSAYDVLEKAIEDRKDGMTKFNSMLATPFGQPSEISKAMAGVDASVDSIINQYNAIAEALENRFAGIAPEGKDMLLDYFKVQTQGLIELAKRRVIAVKVLADAQEDLKQLVDEQRGFTTGLKDSLKDFATALIDISKSDSAAVYTVTKTATGLIISQTRKSTNAIDTITKNLQSKLASVIAFTSNINKLLASGLNAEYIRQLLGAGPEAAGQTAAALAGASSEQIASINKLYKDINAQATAFSSDMGDKFYTSAINMAEQFAAGSTLGLQLIDAVMTDMTTNISNVLGILGDTGLTNAKALVDALTAEFTRQANETVGPATQLVVDKIRTTIKALKVISLINAQAFMDGLITTLSGEDNKARYTASADQIRANIDTIMKMLAPEALTSGLGLIASLASAFGGANLESVKNAALAIQDGIASALDLLKGKGTEVAADLAQELYDKLLAEKARLVALAQSIAAAIAAALASAAASIGVDVDDLGGGGGGGGFDVAAVRIGEEKDRGGTQEFNRAVTSVAEAASSAVGSAKAATSAIKKTATAVTKSSSTFSKTQLQLVKEGLAAAKTNTVNTTTLAGVMRASVKSPNAVTSTSMPNFRPEATKTKFTGSNTVSRANMPFGGQTISNVTINTKNPPSASQTKAVVNAAVKAASGARK